MSKSHYTPDVTQDVSQDAGQEQEPGHDLWFRQSVEAALNAKAEGRANYRDLRTITAKFKFDAR